jgi:hypothetical protein
MFCCFLKVKDTKIRIVVLMSGVRMERGIARFCFFHREMNKNELWNIGS